MSTIELVSYKLKSQVNSNEVKAANAGVNEFCLSQPGFLYRSVSRDDDNTWYDIVYWKSQDNAKAAGEAFMQSAAGQALVALIDPTSMDMKHMPASSEAWPEMA